MSSSGNRPPMAAGQHPFPAWAEQIRSLIARDVAATMKQTPTVAMARRNVQKAHDLVDREMSQIFEAHQERARLHPDRFDPIDCKEGCSWCCHVRVGALPAEAIEAMAYVEETFSPEAKAALRERLAAYRAKVESMGVEQRATRPIQCPFLVDHRCSIHPARPNNCRMHHSMDVEQCKKLVEGETVPIPTVPDFQHAVFPVNIGLYQGFRGAKMRGNQMDFSRMAALIAEDPTVPDRWLSGELAFDPVDDPELREFLNAASQGGTVTGEMAEDEG